MPFDTVVQNFEPLYHHFFPSQLTRTDIFDPEHIL